MHTQTHIIHAYYFTLTHFLYTHTHITYTYTFPHFLHTHTNTLTYTCSHTYYTHTHTFPIHIHKHVCAAHIGFLGVNHDFMAYIPVCTSFFFSPSIWYTSRQYLERMNGLGRPSISTHTDMPHSFWQLHNLLCMDVTKFT